MPAPALFKTDDDIFTPRHLLGWVAFSMTAGCVNAGAFLACRNFVSHVTGVLTNLSLDVLRPPLALEYALVLAAFVAGAALATLAAETWGGRRRAAYALPLALAFVALVAVALAGRAGLFGEFGAATSETGGQASFALLGALAAVMGLLNASVALATANGIRATHMTGPATDLAANLVRGLLASGDAAARERRWGLLRAAKLTAFATGGVVAAANAARLEYDVFMVAAGMLVVALGLTAAPAGEPLAAPARRDAREPLMAPARRDVAGPADGDA
ncbi:MAG TPA: DUF1275 domain-containing transporter [Polyangiaceae bacterium]|nr:DUF1275 domain-containing transporter [Polyangiaceae bacterium]